MVNQVTSRDQVNERRPMQTPVCVLCGEDEEFLYNKICFCYACHCCYCWWRCSSCCCCYYSRMRSLLIHFGLDSLRISFENQTRANGLNEEEPSQANKRTNTHEKKIQRIKCALTHHLFLDCSVCSFVQCAVFVSRARLKLRESVTNSNSEKRHWHRLRESSAE